MVMSIFQGKARPAATQPVETSLARIVRHPLTREEAQARGAIGNEKKRQRREIEALVMETLRVQSPLLYVLGETFPPSYRRKLIFEKPELLEALMKLFGVRGATPTDQAQPHS